MANKCRKMYLQLYNKKGKKNLIKNIERLLNLIKKMIINSNQVILSNKIKYQANKNEFQIQIKKAKIKTMLKLLEVYSKNIKKMKGIKRFNFQIFRQAQNRSFQISQNHCRKALEKALMIKYNVFDTISKILQICLDFKLAT